MKPGSVTIVIPSFAGDARGVLQALAAQSLTGWDHVVAARTAPAARARNRGAWKAAGEFLIFVDDDIVLNSPDALMRMVEALRELGPKDAVNITWRLSPHANWIGRRFAKDPLFTFDRFAPRPEMSWRECGAACFAIRADWFRSLSGFDEKLLSGEDCDLAYRITKHGGKIHTLPQFWLEHRPPRTVRGVIHKILWYERGNAQVARKHPEAGYRVNLDRWWKAALYLIARTLAFVPLIFCKVNYLNRKPRLAFRPAETFFSYIGAWAYAAEWIFPSKTRTAEPGSGSIVMAEESHR